MVSVGLTGGIACGKSAVLERLRVLGALTYEADRIADDIVRAAPVIDRIRKEFGEGVIGPEGGLDRARLAALIFADDASRLKLNAIVHPLVISHIETEIDSVSAAAPTKLIVFEVALLVEADMLSLFDKIVVVTSTPEARLARLTARGLSEEEALARIRSQVSDAERMRYADFILINKGTPATLAEECSRLYETLTAEVAAGS